MATQSAHAIWGGQTNGCWVPGGGAHHPQTPSNGMGTQSCRAIWGLWLQPLELEGWLENNVYNFERCVLWELFFLYLHGQCFMSCVCPATQLLRWDLLKDMICSGDPALVASLDVKKLYLSLLQMPTCPLQPKKIRRRWYLSNYLACSCCRLSGW